MTQNDDQPMTPRGLAWGIIIALVLSDLLASCLLIAWLARKWG